MVRSVCMRPEPPHNINEGLRKPFSPVFIDLGDPLDSEIEDEMDTEDDHYNDFAGFSNSDGENNNEDDNDNDDDDDDDDVHEGDNDENDEDADDDADDENEDDSDNIDQDDIDDDFDEDACEDVDQSGDDMEFDEQLEYNLEQIAAMTSEDQVQVEGDEVDKGNEELKADEVHQPTLDQSGNEEIKEAVSRIPETPVDCETVLSAMAGFALPPSSFPPWAAVVPESEWNTYIRSRIQSNQTPSLDNKIE